MKANVCLPISLFFYSFLLLVSPLAYTYDAEAHCKAVTIHKEASGEGLLGMRAVLDTLETRIKKNNSSCVKEVSLRGQWSWYSSFAKKGISLKATHEQLTAYERVSRIKPIVKATHFHLVSVKPRWAKKMKFVKKIGKHLFYLDVSEK